MPKNSCSCKIGEHWLATALSRVRAGEPEDAVMYDYGYRHVDTNAEREAFTETEMRKLQGKK